MYFNTTIFKAQAPSKNTQAATMNSSITTITTESKYSEDERKLVRDCLKKAKANNLHFLEDELLDIVALLEGNSFIHEETILSTLQLLNIKLKLGKYIWVHKSLSESKIPPSSVRITTELTSPEEKVVASQEFHDLRERYTTALESFQGVAREVFLESKTLEREEAKDQLKSLFYDKIESIIDAASDMELEHLSNQTDIDKIKEIGGHQLLVAQAWKNIIESKIDGKMKLNIEFNFWFFLIFKLAKFTS